MIADITRDIKAAYRSIEQPNWSFVEERIKTNPYKEIIEGLRRIGASVSESTDLNDDCSRCLFLVREPCELTLRLSLVGKYSCVHYANGTFLTEDNLRRNSLGAELLKLLYAEGVKLLQDSDLRMEVQLGGDHLPFYSVLFSSDGMIS